MLIILRPVAVVLRILVIVSPILLAAVIIRLLVLWVTLIIMRHTVPPRPWARRYWKLARSCTLVSSTLVVCTLVTWDNQPKRHLTICN